MRLWDEELVSRLVLALRSGLPNEVEGALGKILRVSSQCGPTVSQQALQILLQELFDLVDPVIEVNLREPPAVSVDDLFVTLSVVHLHRFFTDRIIPEKLNSIPEAAFTRREFVDLVTNVYLAIRNLSFLDLNYIGFILQNATFLKQLVQCLQLAAQSSRFTELGICVLDLLESLGHAIHLNPKNQSILQALQALLLTSSDRALLIGSLRSLTKLATGELNEPAFTHLTGAFYERLYQLLLIDDEPLQSAALDLLYQLTGNAENVAKIGRTLKNNGVKILLRFALSASAVGQRLPGPTSGPRGPGDEVVYREALKGSHVVWWLRANCEPANDGHVSHNQLYQEYLESCKENEPPAPLLPVPDFTRALRSVFPQVSMQSTQAGQMATRPQFVVTGLRFKATRDPRAQWRPAEQTTAGTKVDPIGDGPAAPLVPELMPSAMNGVAFACRWTDCESGDELGSELALMEHIAETHLADNQAPYHCHWGHCQRFEPAGVSERKWALAHVKTHLPSIKSPMPSVDLSEEPMEAQTPPMGNPTLRASTSPSGSQSHSGETDAGGGISFSAALVLRNMARVAACRPLFAPYEQQFLSLMNVPSLTQPVVSILCELRHLER